MLKQLPGQTDLNYNPLLKLLINYKLKLMDGRTDGWLWVLTPVLLLYEDY